MQQEIESLDDDSIAEYLILVNQVAAIVSNEKPNSTS